MIWKSLFATKSLELLKSEAEGENRLRRILGPISLTSLGIGAIIGAGIFVVTGSVAANTAGPAVLVSFLIAGIACAFAAFCYAEFASLAPVAGSAYTYAYATLGELFAWIIGWDLVLEYAVSGSTVASEWTGYFNTALDKFFGFQIPEFLSSDPFSKPGAWLNLPAMLILALITTILVLGIRESAYSNTLLVLVKLGAVLFVIGLGAGLVRPFLWTTIEPWERKWPEEHLLQEAAVEVAADEVKRGDLPAKGENERIKTLKQEALALFKIEKAKEYGTENDLARYREKYGADLPTTPAEEKQARAVLKKAHDGLGEQDVKNWGLFAYMGVTDKLRQIDADVRSPFFPYGLSGVMLGASIVFFAFLGFDSISTHSEEAIRPQRDVPFGIIASLVICSVLYMGVAAVITGMVPYPDIDSEAAIAVAFSQEADRTQSWALNLCSGLIAVGALAGMTSVLLITYLSQARIFLAMARDGLLPHSIFGVVHERFRTPHMSTIVTGAVTAVIAAFVPEEELLGMVNIGTLFAFIVVCSAVWMLRFKRPDAPRPFRCPFIHFVAPAGILVNLILMLFLPILTWARLLIWLLVGLLIYFAFGYRYSALRRGML
ncbi:MAG: amino acid permease [Gemmataceae bacterium]